MKNKKLKIVLLERKDPGDHMKDRISRVLGIPGCRTVSGQSVP